MEVKKSENADLRKNITIYALMGLAFMLLLSWQGLEYESKEVETQEVYEEVVLAPIEEDIPITQMLNTPPPPPPPPPAPEVIKVVEDEVEIEEVIIQDTETDEQEEIVEVEAVSEEVGVVETIADVPFAIIENVPIYPGCEGENNNADRKKCMQEKITRFVNKNFNTGLANEIGLTGKQTISVQFKIDKSGNITGIQSRAKDPKLQAEAARVINKLPKMTPGKQRGKPVGVIYGLPIIFEVQD
ncbi:energy transducer TonB [Nonlabens marinus]|uniref:TonB family protein n=1 Tax=Nonlabens marinus S1-08 TaxID=1454201 RepID=W8VQL6_9FLAO|nr:energy transducer TonB [Nonlabens marinus]BAO55145.1 TonB family protein [Nonlabens marinus S1-08]